MNIIALNATDEAHLEEVKAEMKIKGAPIIKAVYVEAHDAYVALEGSHRIAAAKELGLTPVIAEVKFEDIVDVDNDYADKVDVSELSDDLDLCGNTIYNGIFARDYERANAGLIYNFD